MRRQNQSRLVSLILAVLSSFLVINLVQVEARKEGDDIIMTKGKLIMRGGKGKGHLILDTGKSSEHEDSHHHMMPMMPHHFNSYAFYPMQHQQSHAPMIHVHPVYIEDHSAMHNHQPEASHHQHHEYQHHEEQHYPEHHGMEYQHHEPQHHQMHHQPRHHE